MIIHADHRQAWVIKLTSWHYLVKTLVFFNHLWHIMQKRIIFLCVYELVNKVEIYFMEVHCIKTDYLCAFMNW